MNNFPPFYPEHMAHLQLYEWVWLFHWQNNTGYNWR